MGPDRLDEQLQLEDNQPHGDFKLGAEGIVREMLVRVGEDPDREGLLRTPRRVDRSMAFLTQGYRMNLDEIVNDALFTEDCEDIVLVRDIEFYSLCEHHMLPFFGTAHVAYIPNGKVIGLSKIPRIIDLFARRLQVQERMTRQIAQCLQQVLNPKGIAVITNGKHLCMMMRGVEKQNSFTTTSSMLGAFRSSPQTRNELLALLNSKYQSQ